MRFRVRALPLALIAAAMMLLVACGGDDSKAEKKTRDGTTAPTAALGQASGGTSGGTSGGSGSSSSAATAAPTSVAQAQATQAPANTSRALDLDCGKDLKAFRFDGRLALQAPGTGGAANSSDPTALVSSLLGDVKFSGAYVAPDRTSFKFEGGKDSLLGGQAIEFIQIGTTSYTRFGATGWQSSTGTGGPMDFTENLDPRQLCTSLKGGLTGDAPSRKEKVNGVDAVRYDYDRKTLEKLSKDNPGPFGEFTGGEIPENFKMNIWVSEKEKFPVKMLVSGSGTDQGQKYSLELEFNVTDLNGNVKIDPPR